MVKLFHHAMDRGLYWLETADLYKTHPHVQAFLKEIKRQKVVITSKTLSKDAGAVRQDIERFRKELNTDYIDILLLHCMSDPSWPAKMKGPMEALSEAKEKRLVRAIGCSLHVLEALEAASKEPWGDVYVVRINPFAINMDVDNTKRIFMVERALKTLHKQGKAVYGMKLLGGTNPHLGKSHLQGKQIDESLRFALSRPYLDGFTMGFSREKDIDDIIKRIRRVQLRGAEQEKA
jgi:predicted aldo/keto reductase-like oxidoreductase